MPATRIVTIINANDFRAMMTGKKIQVSSHAMFRLDEAQRKVYNESVLITKLAKERPRLAGVQENGRYTALFVAGDGYLRIILNATQTHVEIITFFITQNLPRIRHGNKAP
ncbi:hypothetical protein HY642_05795 [Candidatus Woesearchaeota archaeon]|nr:hypothetical protein [Candidatus Woesearchaeota archaeon]